MTPTISSRRRKGRSPFKRNQFGGTIGGPVVIPKLYNGRDKTFFFVATEFFREVKNIPQQGTYPTPTELTGDLRTQIRPGVPLIDPLSGAPFPDNRIPQNRMPATLLPFLQTGIGNGPWIPAPNSSVTGFNFFRDDARRFNRDQVIVRGDQRLGDGSFIYGRYAFNDGDGTFSDRSDASGIGAVRGNFGLFVLTGDLDNDGWPDIYVANDTKASLLFRNKHDGTFEEIGVFAGVAYNSDGKETSGMGIAAADYNRDGWLDIFKTNFSDESASLYRASGDGFFVEDSEAAGVGRNKVGRVGLRLRRFRQRWLARSVCCQWSCLPRDR